MMPPRHYKDEVWRRLCLVRYYREFFPTRRDLIAYNLNVAAGFRKAAVLAAREQEYAA